MYRIDLTWPIPCSTIYGRTGDWNRNNLVNSLFEWYHKRKHFRMKLLLILQHNTRQWNGSPALSNHMDINKREVGLVISQKGHRTFQVSLQWSNTRALKQAFWSNDKGQGRLHWNERNGGGKATGFNSFLDNLTLSCQIHWTKEQKLRNSIMNTRTHR